MTLVTAEIDIPPPAIYTLIAGSGGAGMVRACTDGGELQIARLRHWTRLSVFVQAPAQEVRGGCDSARVGGTCRVRLGEGGMCGGCGFYRVCMVFKLVLLMLMW